MNDNSRPYIPLHKGVTVWGIEKIDDNWWKGRTIEEKGWVPAEFVSEQELPSTSNMIFLPPQPPAEKDYKSTGGSGSRSRNRRFPGLPPAMSSASAVIQSRLQSNQNIHLSANQDFKPTEAQVNEYIGRFPLMRNLNLNFIPLYKNDKVIGLEKMGNIWIIKTIVKEGFFPANRVTKYIKRVQYSRLKSLDSDSSSSPIDESNISEMIKNMNL